MILLENCIQELNINMSMVHGWNNDILYHSTTPNSYISRVEAWRWLKITYSSNHLQFIKLRYSHAFTPFMRS